MNDSELCPKDRRKKHEPQAFNSISNPTKLVKVVCRKCGKVLFDSSRDAEETAFPDLVQ